jgi:hypothetical protein
VAATICNSNPFRDKNSRTVNPEDFVPGMETNREPTEEEKTEQFKQLLTSMRIAQEARAKAAAQQ